MSTFSFSNVRVFTGSEFLDHTSVQVQDGLITSLGHSPEHSATEIDGRGLTLVPGFIDLQVYGGNGVLFSTEPTAEAIHKNYEEHRRGGTTHFQITYHTGPLTGMLAAIRACHEYNRSGGEGLVGLHLEGPYFNPVKRGAHLLSYIRKATINELQQLTEAAGDLPLYLTLAPEQADPEVLDWLLASPIILSAGHSNATYTEAVSAFGKGIELVTHLFNAMSPFNSREPGLLGATFDSNVRASIIVDGIHVDFASVRIAKKLLGERLFFITDAVTTDTRGEYAFHFNEKTNRYEDENGTLSGSSLQMIQAVSNAVQHVGISEDEALRMASLYPAQIIGKEHRLGRIAPGYEGSFVLYDASYAVKAVVVKGQITWL